MIEAPGAPAPPLPPTHGMVSLSFHVIWAERLSMWLDVRMNTAGHSAYQMKNSYVVSSISNTHRLYLCEDQAAEACGLCRFQCKSQ